MNEQHLASIEERWLKASGGPWTIDDQRRPVGERGLAYTTLSSIKEFSSGKSENLKTVVISTFGDAVGYGLVRDNDEWQEFVEKHLKEGVRYEQIASSCRLIFCTKPNTLASLRAKEDKAVANGGVRQEPLSVPSFAVLEPSEEFGRATQADIDFILHAPEDVGALITGMRKANETIEGLTEELVRTKAELETAKSSAMRSKATIEKLVSVAADIQKLAKG